ncbi:MAG: hypothetical protein ACT4QG_13660 [Sporichthyaceae bacterium]
MRRSATVAAFALVLAVATPHSGSAANGFFVYTDGETGVPRQLLTTENETGIVFPPNEKCFDTFGAVSAKNYTDSDAVLAGDGVCSQLVIVLKPGESYEGKFGSVGFTPPGATGD